MSPRRDPQYRLINTTTTTKMRLLILLYMVAIVQSRPVTDDDQNSLDSEPELSFMESLLLPGMSNFPKYERDTRDIELEVRNQEVIEIDSPTPERLKINDDVLLQNVLHDGDDGTSEDAELVQKEPTERQLMSTKEGNYRYTVNNSTELKERARLAFESLIPDGGKDSKKNMLPETRPRSKNRKKKPGRRKDKEQHVRLSLDNDKPLEGRRDALYNIANGHKSQVCSSQKFKQRVKHPGCLTKVVVNRLCHGACSSFFIPRMKSKKLKAVFQSCAACAPREYDAVTVTLDCPGMEPAQITKSVMVVKSCECRNVELPNMVLA